MTCFPLLWCCSHCDLHTAAHDPHLCWLLLHSFSLSGNLPSFLLLLFLCVLLWLIASSSSPPPPPVPHLFPIIFLGDPRGLCAELTCHESFGQQLLKIPSLPVYPALVITQPLSSFFLHPSISLLSSPPLCPLSAGLSLPTPTLCLCFPFSLYDAIFLSLFPSFILVLFPTAGLRSASFTTLLHRKNTIST